MSDHVLITLVIAVAVACLVVVFVLRGRLRIGNLKVSRDGIEGGVETHGLPATKIVGVKIKGDRNKMTAADGGQIDQAEVEGHGNEMNSHNS
jgi:hypothetical protein